MFGLFIKKQPEEKFWTIPNGEVIKEERFRYLARAKRYRENKSVAILGWDAYNPENPVLLDLATAPHVLVAGTTGSGKSVAVNTIICSLLAKNSPDDFKIYICDPKMVDYIAYKGIPHLARYSTNVSDATDSLNEIHRIMMARYEAMQKEGVANISDMSKRVPRILLVCDEFASLANKEAKKSMIPVLQDILRLGRAAGIHCIISTQRPDRTVIDGQLKSNCPTRLCFRVQSATDSRVILDCSGGQNLNGMGDGMLMKSNGDLFRFQGLYMDDSQKNEILDYWKKQA